MTRWSFLFDSDCCFCAGFARFIERRSRGAISAVALNDRAAVERIFSAAPSAPSDLLGSFHLVEPGRRWLSGPEALPELVALVLPFGGLWRRLLAASPAKFRSALCRRISETRWDAAPTGVRRP